MQNSSLPEKAGIKSLILIIFFGIGINSGFVGVASANLDNKQSGGKAVSADADSSQKNQNDIKESIVKIYTVANEPDYSEPWNSSTAQFSGSGSIIEGNKILTNAHVIADSTFLEVKRYGQTKRYEATVEAVSHDADLALITIKDKAFFNGARPIQLGELPTTQQEVIVYGFPTGGDTLSVTTGVVSRIEHQSYVHSSEYLLSVQIDAAINPGNSGGPVISDGKLAGVVMQGLSGADNIGYMVPTNIVQHFFTDIADGQYDGFPDIGIIVQEMENPSSRKRYKLSDEQTGVLAYKILNNSPAKNIIKPGDILTHIDGHNIANDGTVEFRHKEYTSFGFYIDSHQIGDQITFDLIRDSKPKSVKFTLNATSKDFWLVQREEYDKYPRYFIFGGFVFTPLTKNYISAGYSFFSSAGELSELLDEWPTDEKKEAVILSQVLAADINKGYHELYDWVVEKIDGKTFKDFDEFFNLMATAKGDFIVLEDKDGYEIVIDRKLAEKENKNILERYHIDAARSRDFEDKKTEQKDALVQSGKWQEKASDPEQEQEHELKKYPQTVSSRKSGTESESKQGNKERPHQRSGRRI
jgi:S1-C subfamily serine protease